MDDATAALRNASQPSLGHVNRLAVFVKEAVRRGPVEFGNIYTRWNDADLGGIKGFLDSTVFPAHSAEWFGDVGGVFANMLIELMSDSGRLVVWSTLEKQRLRSLPRL